MEFRLGRRALVVPVLAAFLTAAAGVGGYFLTRDDARDAGRQRFLKVLAPAQVEFAGAVDAAFQEFSLLGAADPAAPTDASAAAAGLDAVTEVGPDGMATAGARVQAAFDIARDTGMVRAAAPVTLAGHRGPVTLLVLPRYRSGQPSGTTADRRASLTGYTVGVLAPASLARQHLAAIGGTVVVRDAGTTLFRSGPAAADDGETVRTRLDVGGRNWAISAHPALGGAGTTPVAVLSVGLLLALGMLLTGRALHDVEAEATGRARDREDDLSTIADLGPLLQQSLELAEVLPSATAFLADHFGLHGVAVAYVDEDGDLVQAFSLGHRVPGLPEHGTDVHPPPHEISAGKPFSVPLLRGGRAIGAIHALPGRDLGPERTRTLVSVADMFGTAVANARQFEREQLAVRRLQELDRLKTEFLGTVSHELRTPIAAIVGFSGLLNAGLEEMPIAEQRDFLSRLMRNASSLSSLVQDLLDFSRIGRPSFELRAEELDLAELTGRIISQMATPDQEHRYVIDAAHTVWAFADADAVERVVTNLLSNAAKFSPPDSVITVTLGQHGEAATLTVDDMGPGVAEGDRPLVFQRFYRGTSAAAMATRGAGIGLAVVKDVVDRMGGSVAVDTAPSGGGRFVVVLPARPAAPSSPSTSSSTSSAATKGGTP
ncbi:MAG: two-component system, OmpR family, phosphate regulon sensor histidine kinase PhoR [Actinomycetota bacterium]|nr:two-component system, OmpR family, phosphate regulon sensor histidine kinase PhoR [Actinomycetota bacterium]